MIYINKKEAVLFILIFILFQDVFAAGAADNIARAALKQTGKIARRSLQNVDNVLKHSGRHASSLAKLGWRHSDKAVRVSALHAVDLARLSVRHGDTVARLGIKDGDDLIRNFSEVRLKSRSSGIPSNRVKLPRNGVNGKWENPFMAGNSQWHPDMNRIPPPNKNPDGKTFKELISGNANKDYGGIGLSKAETEKLQHNLLELANGNTGIKYVNNGPDFSPYSAHSFSLDSRMTGRYHRGGTSTEADKMLAQKLGKDQKDVRKWINDNQYVWHERPDGLTVDLISHDINANIPHSGGISFNKHLAGN